MTMWSLNIIERNDNGNDDPGVHTVLPIMFLPHIIAQHDEWKANFA